MWLALAFLSAALLGFYDVFKKMSLKDNAVLPVLFLNTVFCALIFIPFILLSKFSPETLQGGMLYVPEADLATHGLVFLKSMIVLTSWTFGYFGIKHLPITIVGPINATRPIMVLIGAMLIYGERLNWMQFIGVSLAILSLYLLSLSGKKEGINFAKNKWILCVAIAAVAGAASGLYDKFLLQRVHPMVVQSWFNIYQVGIMGLMLLLIWYPRRHKTTPFTWKWTILCISIFLSLADFAYFYALTLDGVMISIVSMVRRGSVIVSFLFGALIFRERNLKSKALDLLLVLISMIFLYLGSN